MLRRFAGLPILVALLAYACTDQAPSTAQVNSFGAPLTTPSAAPLLDLAGFNPAGNVTMTLTTTVDHDNNITAATAAFSGNLSGLPLGTSLTSAHVNSGVSGTTGPVVIDLQIQSGQVTFVNGSASLSATVPVSPSTAQQIIANPASFYFQADTAVFPNGILRGQF